MKNSIRTELTEYINDAIKEGREITHFNLFNEDYYMVGYYNAELWLKMHELSIFEGITEAKQYLIDNFGQCLTEFDNAETLVNNLVYFYGQEICIEMNIPSD